MGWFPEERCLFRRLRRIASGSESKLRSAKHDAAAEAATCANQVSAAMKETLEVINRMQADGVIDQYAIGGAVGATFYLEPIATVDLDIFVDFPVSHGS